MPRQRVGTLRGTGPKLPWHDAKAFSSRNLTNTRAREVMRAKWSPELRRASPPTAMVRLGMAAATVAEAAAERRRKGLVSSLGKAPAWLRGDSLRNLATFPLTKFLGIVGGYSTGIYKPILPWDGDGTLAYPTVVVSR